MTTVKLGGHVVRFQWPHCEIVNYCVLTSHLRIQPHAIHHLIKTGGFSLSSARSTSNACNRKASMARYHVNLFHTASEMRIFWLIAEPKTKLSSMFPLFFFFFAKHHGEANNKPKSLLLRLTGAILILIRAAKKLLVPVFFLPFDRMQTVWG